jgi:hypothetical protein
MTIERFISRCRVVLLGTILATALAPAHAANGGSGNVLPPDATPHGWSLEDMAAAVANFTASGNDLSYYPDTPFQILYRLGSLQDPTGHNTFTLEPGTALYIKFFFVDDSPPVYGTFPTDADEAAHFVFDPDQLGAHDLEIVVDGRVTPIGPEYVPAPVDTPNSPDGSQHLIQVGAFLTPLNKGTHHVTIRGTYDGDLWGEIFFPGFVFHSEINYTVIVE